jgi:hypothetical protein
MSARAPRRPLPASLASSIEDSKWSRDTQAFMSMGLASSATGEKRFRQGWVEILRELFPGSKFSIAPLSYKERQRAGADYEVCTSICSIAPNILTLLPDRYCLCQHDTRFSGSAVWETIASCRAEGSGTYQ